MEAARKIEMPEYIITRRKNDDDFDRIDIDLPSARIGNVRCRLDPDKVTVFSIQIFPEFQRRGYGRDAVNMLKHSAQTIIADRVRFTARPFWEKMGFVARGDGNWVFQGVRRTKFTAL